ncbi:hypothetical protein BLOT_001385 [Blomia tropicalis]|nr:hypothetical protein BLOT_001385 [Blomia tropicalis]
MKRITRAQVDTNTTSDTTISTEAKNYSSIDIISTVDKKAVLDVHLSTIDEYFEVCLRKYITNQNQIHKEKYSKPILDLYLVKGNPTLHLYSLEMLEVQQSSPSTMELLALVNRLQDELKQKSKIPLHEVKKCFMLTLVFRISSTKIWNPSPVLTSKNMWTPTKT